MAYLATILPRCRCETVTEALQVLEIPGALQFRSPRGRADIQLTAAFPAWFQEVGSHDYVQKDCRIGYSAGT